MKIRVHESLPYITVSLVFRGQHLEFQNILLDTGSAGSVFSADKVEVIGLQYEPDDAIYRIRGVAGAEFVYGKRVDRLSVGELAVADIEIEVGAMDYGFEIDGILGMDFLTQVGAIIDLAQLEVRGRSD